MYVMMDALRLFVLFQMSGAFGGIICLNSYFDNCSAMLDIRIDLYSTCKQLPLIKVCLAPYLDTCNGNALLSTILSKESSLKEQCKKYGYLKEPESSTSRSMTVLFMLETPNVMLKGEVKMSCCSNIGSGIWYIFKRSRLLFIGESIGYGFNSTKFKGHIVNSSCYELTINNLEMSELDNYTCTHQDTPSEVINLEAVLQQKYVQELPTKRYGMVLGVVFGLLVVLVVFALTFCRRKKSTSRKDAQAETKKYAANIKRASFVIACLLPNSADNLIFEGAAGMLPHKNGTFLRRESMHEADIAVL